MESVLIKIIPEVRVRALTRFIVTAHDGSGTHEIGEYAELATAERVAQSLARTSELNGCEPAKYVPYGGALPGRVMRCKVTLTSRSNAFKRKDGGWSTQNEPDEVVLDGEHLQFAAICPPTCNSAPNASPENAIFGEYTPSFNLSCHVRNGGVLDALERGADYYVDFTPAPAVVTPA